MADENRWELKYKDLRRDYMALEKQLDTNKKALEPLCKIAKMLSIGLRGEDANLDAQLEKLYDALNQNQLENLKGLSKSLDKQLRKKDTRKKRSANALLVPLRKWISNLRTLTEEDFNLNNLDSIKQRSESAVENYHDIPSLISSVVRLQTDILKDIQGSGSTTAFHTESLTDEEFAHLLRQISHELLDLIATLHMPSNRKLKAQQLAKKLESGIHLDELPDTVLRIIQLVNHSCSYLNEEFEGYLRQVSTELLDMYSELTEQHGIFSETGQKQMELSQEVATGVSNLQVSAQKATSLNTLKDVVKTQLGSVQQQVHELRTSEKARLEMAEIRYSALSSKVKEVEQEARETQQKAEEERIRSRIDQLTRLPNRLGYDEKFARCIERADASKLALTLAVCDIDFFKRINDNYGHLTGDKALKLIGRVLQDSLRGTDFVARYGGEEFTIIMQDTDIESSEKILERVRAAIEQSPFNFNGKPIPITVSFGAAEYQTGEATTDLFDRADKALYQAKQDGRNCIRLNTI